MISISTENVDIPLSPDDSKKINYKKSKHKTNIILGLVFILPALAALIFTKILPVIMTFIQSFKERFMIDSAEFVGFNNYERLFSTPVGGKVIGFTLLLTVSRVLLVLVPPLLLALGASAIKPKLQKVIRVISTFPWMIYSPIALSVVWMLLINPNLGFEIFTKTFFNAETSRVLILFLDGLSFFGLSCGLGMTVYLSTINGTKENSSSKGLVRNLVILAVVLVLGTIAVSLQGGESIVFTTNGFPELTTMSVYPYITNLIFNISQNSVAAALASPVIIVIGILGIGIALITVLSHLRLFNLTEKADPVQMSKAMKIILVILMIFILLAILISLSPYLIKSILLISSSGIISSERINMMTSDMPFWRILLNTWITPLAIIVLIQFPITYLAALGIGALRPFGKSSEWLLLLFAPWLFIRPMLYLPGMLPMLLELGLNDSFIGFALPYILNIPMLFVLTLFFRGQAHKYTENNQEVKFFRDYVLASLPLAIICIVFSVVTIQQDLIWSTVILSDPTKWMLSNLFNRLRAINIAGIGEYVTFVTLVRIPAVVLGFIVLGAYQVFYLPKLGISLGRDKVKSK